jgi:hypothetical protein
MGPPLAYFGLVIGIALLFVMLFYLGPALAAQSSKRSLFSLAEVSFGTMPAMGFRICCAFYLVLWLSFSVQTVVVFLYRWPYHREPTGLESAILPAVITLFLFATALQTLGTNAKLALFTNKLSLAILIAALIRVREGWPSAWDALSHSPGFMQATDWRRVPFLFFYFAPLALFASDFGKRSRTRREAAIIGLVGLALSFAVSLFAASFVAHATYALHWNLGNGSTIAAALFREVSARYLPPRMMVTAITMFGSARFGIRALADSVPFEAKTARRVVLVLMACCIVILAAANPAAKHSVLEILTRCLVVTAAIFSADFIAVSREIEKPKRVEWIGTISFLVGLGTPFLWSYLFGLDISLFVPGQVESWWFPWLLPSYAVSFVTCLLLRMGRLLWLARRRLQLQ